MITTMVMRRIPSEDMRARPKIQFMIGVAPKGEDMDDSDSQTPLENYSQRCVAPVSISPSDGI